MTINNTLVLSIAYVAPLVLLAMLIARSQTHHSRYRTVIALMLLPVFYMLHYQGLQQLGGWPSTQDLPDEFTLLGQQIKEPDKRSGNTGYIRLWVQAEDEGASRLYELPYSQTLHKALAAAQQRQAQGRQQQGRRISGNNNAIGDASSRGDRLSFFDKETRRPPAKTHQ